MMFWRFDAAFMVALCLSALLTSVGAEADEVKPQELKSLKVFAQRNYLSGRSGLALKETPLEIPPHELEEPVAELKKQTTIDVKKADVTVVVLRDRRELAAWLGGKKGPAEEKAVEQYEARVKKVLGVGELDWRKHMLIMAFEAGRLRIPTIRSLESVKVAGKGLQVRMKWVSTEFGIIGNGSTIALVERAEGLKEVSLTADK